MTSDYNLVFLSVPTSGGGATASATYGFFTSGYRTPRQGRSTAQDIVHNQNGITKHRYDNGPNVYEWDPFDVIISDKFRNVVDSATLQWSRLRFLWNYKEGPMGMEAPDGVYTVDWADAPLERQMVRFPGSAGDKAQDNDMRVRVTIEEGG